MIQPKTFISKFIEKGAYCQKVTYIDTSKEYDIFAQRLYKDIYHVSHEEAINRHIEIFYKDKNDYEHQCEYRIMFYNKRLSAIKKGLIVHLDGLTQYCFDMVKHNPTDCSGIDIICYTKNRFFKSKAIFKKNE